MYPNRFKGRLDLPKLANIVINNRGPYAGCKDIMLDFTDCTVRTSLTVHSLRFTE